MGGWAASGGRNAETDWGVSGEFPGVDALENELGQGFEWVHCNYAGRKWFQKNPGGRRDGPLVGISGRVAATLQATARRARALWRRWSSLGVCQLDGCSLQGLRGPAQMLVGSQLRESVKSMARAIGGKSKMAFLGIPVVLALAFSDND